VEILCDKSESNGMFRGPSPPSFRGVLTQAKWVKCESTEQAYEITGLAAELNFKMKCTFYHKFSVKRAKFLNSIIECQNFCGTCKDIHIK
jgi:hypothetical protein